MNRLTRFGVAAAFAAASVVAFAQMGRPDPNQSAIDTRQALFKVISSQFGPVAAVLRPGGSVSAEVAATNGARINMLAGMIPEMFARDTREYKEGKTKALDGIWNSMADFKAKADGLASAGDALAAAGKSGDAAAIKTAAQEVGKACGACHDNFRAK
jgi:cytochrome c556